MVFLAYFFIYSFLGWVLDSTYSTIVSGHVVFGGLFKSMLVPLPFAPIYGFGALILIALHGFLLRRSPVIRAILVGVILTAVEYCGGVASSWLLQRRVWDYSQNFANFQGHIDLVHSLGWLVAGNVFLHFFHPRAEKFFNTVFLPYVLNFRYRDCR